MRNYLVLAALFLTACDNTEALQRAERAREVESRCECLELEEGLVRARFNSPMRDMGACRGDSADYQSIMDEADALNCPYVPRSNLGQISCDVRNDLEEPVEE